MASVVMLAPNPNRSGSIDRVIIIGQSDDRALIRVLNIDALAQNPQLLKRYNPSYLYATVLWNAVSVAVLIGGVIASFVWQWWLFVIGLATSVVIHRSNKKSVVDFAQQVLTENPSAIQHFASLGLVWDTSSQSVVPE